MALAGNGFISQSAVAPIAAGLLLGAVGAINPIAGANVNTVRQTVTPHMLLGRVTAVASVGAAAAITAGSFVGGIVADEFGLPATLIVGGILPLLGMGWLLVSPVRQLRTLDVSESPDRAAV